MSTVIAEIGSVHDGSFGNALRLIDAAAAAGADQVKFQTHIAEAESVAHAPSPAHFTEESRIAYFRRTAFDRMQWRRLADHAASVGVQFLSSPFSIEAVDLLEEIGASAYKVASGEVTNVPLLERIAATRKPVFLSSGMSSWSELDRAVSVLSAAGQLTVMQCSSVYPCPPERVGLNVLGDMRVRYGLPVGYSDHTFGFAAPFAAAALGATAIEKHFTFSRLMYGSDAKFGMEPGEFSQMVTGLREIWNMLAAPVNKDDLHPYREMKQIFEKSIVAARDLVPGSTLTRDMLAFKKPAGGLSPAEYRSVVGRRLNRAIAADAPITLPDVE